MFKDTSYLSSNLPELIYRTRGTLVRELRAGDVSAAAGTIRLHNWYVRANRKAVSSR